MTFVTSYKKSLLGDPETCTDARYRSCCFDQKSVNQ